MQNTFTGTSQSVACCCVTPRTGSSADSRTLNTHDLKLFVFRTAKSITSIRLCVDPVFYPYSSLTLREQGTAYFKAIEVQAGKFLFRTIRIRAGDNPPPFLHNYLHDLEGLWWIAMWSLFYTLPSARVQDVQLASKLPQEQAAASIFPLSMTGSERRRTFLASNRDFAQRTACLPPEYASVIQSMRKAADLLCDLYSDLQENSVFHQINTPEPYASIYDPLIRCFQDAIPHAQTDVEYIYDVRARLTRTEQHSSVKRAGEDILTQDSTGQRECSKRVKTEVGSPSTSAIMSLNLAA